MLTLKSVWHLLEKSGNALDLNSGNLAQLYVAIKTDRISEGDFHYLNLYFKNLTKKKSFFGSEFQEHCGFRDPGVDLLSYPTPTAFLPFLSLCTFFPGSHPLCGFKHGLHTDDWKFYLSWAPIKNICWYKFPLWFGSNPPSTYEDTGSIPGLTQWVKDLVLPWAVV